MDNRKKICERCLCGYVICSSSPKLMKYNLNKHQKGLHHKKMMSRIKDFKIKEAN